MHPILLAAPSQPFWASPWYYVNLVLAALLGVLLALLIIPKTRAALRDRFVAIMGRAYQKQLAKEFSRKFPDIYARFSGFRFTPESQAALMSAMKRIPPQEGLKLQTEFMRLTDGFQQRHPELAALIGSLKSNDGKAQAKALQSLFKLPEAQRQSISKDLLWAYDQLSGRFPRWIKLLEAQLKPPAEPTSTPEPATKKT